jgi:endonuclease/exonuclease/phosphatase (EEP) superfamily protein YafD
VRKATLFILRIGGLLSLVAALCAAAEGAAWWCGCVRHWAHLLAVGQFATAAALLLLRNYRLGTAVAASGAAFAVLIALATAPRDALAATPETPGRRLVVAYANLAYFAPTVAAVPPWIRATAPDVFVAAEATDAHEAELAALDDLFPHRYRSVAPHDAANIAVRSRFPLKAPTAYLPAGPLPQVVVDVEVPGGAFRLFATHLFPPLTSEATAWNDVSRRNLAARVRAAVDAGTPAVVVGDFNLSPWSARVAEFERDAGVLRAGRGHGLLVSWPDTPYFPWVGIPIDHAFVGGGVRVRSLTVGPPIGSDHRGLVADLLRP